MGILPKVAHSLRWQYLFCLIFTFTSTKSGNLISGPGLKKLSHASSLAPRFRSFFIPVSDWEGFQDHCLGALLSSVPSVSSSEVRSWKSDSLLFSSRWKAFSRLFSFSRGSSSSSSLLLLCHSSAKVSSRSGTGVFEPKAEDSSGSTSTEMNEN